MGSNMNFYEDKIEAYLTGKLSAADKMTLEQGMNNDPLLKGEVDLQRDIIESLKNSRKLQLKNRLNNINVTATATGVSSAVKIAASLITVGMIGAGIYYLSVFPSKDKEEESVSVIVNENIPSPAVQNSNNDTNNAPVVADIDKNSNQVVVKNNTPVSNSQNVSAIKNNNQVVVANPALPNEGIPTESENFNSNNESIPADKISQSSNVGKAQNVETTIVDTNKKDFSYKYSDNKLFLYGDFKDTPYNLFEIVSPKSKQLYLRFEGNYYELKANHKVSKLKEVKDPSVLEQLNK
jgi:hypothetical protein